MEASTLKKKLSTYVSEGGYLRNVSDELLYELLSAWEDWTGTSKEFYSTIGFSYRQVAGLIGKAKKLKRTGHFGNAEFKEVISIESSPSADPVDSRGNCECIEVRTSNGQIIRFPRVDQLLNYLEKAS